jgi:hypothetical protein
MAASRALFRCEQPGTSTPTSRSMSSCSMLICSSWIIARHVHAYERSRPVYDGCSHPCAPRVPQPRVTAEREARRAHLCFCRCGPVYLNLGDGGNRESAYVPWREPQPAWPAPPASPPSGSAEKEIQPGRRRFLGPPSASPPSGSASSPSSTRRTQDIAEIEPEIEPRYSPSSLLPECFSF